MIILRFVGLSKDLIRSKSVQENGFYCYSLGDLVEVTTIKRSDKNTLMSGNLASKVKEDKLMMKYLPSNRVYFSKKLIDVYDGDHVSCYIDRTSESVFVGAYDEYEMKSGVLMFSGDLGMNGYIESERFVFGNSKMVSTVMKHVMVLSVGVRGSSLFGLYYIPSRKGLAVKSDIGVNYGLSVMTFKPVRCDNYTRFTIDDWFNGTKVIVC